MPSRCEYKIVPESQMTGGTDGPFAERLGARLQALGDDGWELVVVRSQPDGEDLWVFRRPAGTLMKATDEVAASLQRLIDTGRAVTARKPSGSTTPEAVGFGAQASAPADEPAAKTPSGAESPATPEASAPAS